MKLLRTVLALFGSSVAAAAAPDFSTPESAISSLEAAYVNGDIEAAVAARDFAEEARLMLQKINPQLAGDPEMLKNTTEVLELSFRKHMRESGFPDFSNLKCSLGQRQYVTPTLVKLTETCVFPDGGKSVQNLHVFNGPKGWRVITVKS